MRVRVKTIWGYGMVSVANTYVKEAISKKEDLTIEFSTEEMTVPYEKLLTKKPRELSFKDKFGRDKRYSLYDFHWKADKPISVQLSLV